MRHLRTHGVLATGLAYRVVPQWEDEIRFQVSADHTEGDIDAVLAALGDFPRQAHGARKRLCGSARVRSLRADGHGERYGYTNEPAPAALSAPFAELLLARGMALS